jgi:hypothetical protein
MGAMAALARYVYFLVIGKSSLSLAQLGIYDTVAALLSLDYKYSVVLLIMLKIAAMSLS